MTTNLFWNNEEKTIRGSFISLSLTILFAVLITMGIFDTEVATSLKSLESLIIWFFGLSWGIYSAKSVADNYVAKK
jgi:hypothetical protein